MKLMKIFKKTFAVAAAFTALFAMSCANDSSSSVTPGAIDISNAAPGSVITIDGEEVVVLENTYYQDPSRAVSNARSAVQVEGLSEEQNNLIRHYMEEMGGSKIKKMLQDVNINQYVQGWKKGDTKVNMPYLNGGNVYASDYFYYFDKNGKKIAHFKLNWESSKVVQALTGAPKEDTSLAAVKKFEEMTGLPITETLPSGRYDYTTIDVDKYARFRASNDPNVFKCQSFPENINPSKISEKKEIQYTYKYETQGDGENKTVKVTDFDRENLKSWYQSLYYQMIDGKAVGAYNEYPEFNYGEYTRRQFLLRENGISGSVKFYAISRDNYTSGSNPNECKVKITASGKGDIKGNVADAEYKNETQIRTNTSNAFFVFTKIVTGSSVTGENEKQAVNYTLQCKKSDNSDKSKSFAEMTVEFEDKSSTTGTTGTETLTLSEAISKYFSSDLILSEETTEINGWKVPSIIRFRATFLTEGRASHNKKYAWVKLVPEAKGDGFIYQMPINETVAGNDVPENVKIYCDNYRDIYVAGTYNEDYIDAKTDEDLDEFIRAGKTVDFENASITDFTVASGTLANVSSGYRVMNGGVLKVKGLSIKSDSCVRLHVVTDDETKIDRINFNGESVYNNQNTSTQITGDETITLESSRAYIKVPFKGNGTLKFNGESANADYCGKFVVTDIAGKIIYVKTCAKDGESRENSVAITGDSYILYSREGMTKVDNGQTKATGGAHIYKIWVE